MSAFGYGSSYSFKTGDYNPGFTQGMGQDPRQIVSKSGMDTGTSSKGAMGSGPSSIPLSGASDPYGLSFAANKDVNKDMDLAPLFGNPGQSNQLSFLALRQNAGNLSDPSARIAGSAINTANPYAYMGARPTSPDMFGQANAASNYEGAFNYLRAARNRLGGGMGPNDGNGSSLGATLDAAGNSVQAQYQQWLDKMMQSGAFGLTGGGVSYGQRQQGGF